MDVILSEADGLEPVSYTHLDVYKRQHMGCLVPELLAPLGINLVHDFLLAAVWDVPAHNFLAVYLVLVCRNVADVYKRQGPRAPAGCCGSVLSSSSPPYVV